MWAEMKDRRHPTPEEEKKMHQVLGKMFSDPDLLGLISSGTLTVDEKTELTLSLMEEMGLRPATPSQAESIRKAIADWDRVAKSPAENYSSVVEKRIVEIRENAVLFDNLKALLSADQQALVPSLEQLGCVFLTISR